MSTEMLQTQSAHEAGLPGDTPTIPCTDCFKSFLPGPSHLPQAGADK